MYGNNQKRSGVQCRRVAEEMLSENGQLYEVRLNDKAGYANCGITHDPYRALAHFGHHNSSPHNLRHNVIRPHVRIVPTLGSFKTSTTIGATSTLQKTALTEIFDGIIGLGEKIICEAQQPTTKELKMADRSSSTTTTSITNTILSATLSSVQSQNTQNKEHGISAGWASPSSILTRLFAGDPLTIAFAFFVTLTLPLLLHFYFWNLLVEPRGSGDSSSDGIPTFLLLGPSNSGKTSLVATLQKRMIALSTDAKQETEGKEDEEDTHQIKINGNGHTVAAPSTRLSQTTTTVGLLLPPGTPLGSNKYRSENDFEVSRAAQTGTPYKLIDTPGHGKLRLEQALSVISRPNTGLRGVVFMLDSAAIESPDAPVSKDTAQYLHDVLLALQRRPKAVKKAKTEHVTVLVAANKQDLFTALPANAIRGRLQHDVERVRTSKRKGVSAVDAKEDDVDDEDATLAGGGEGAFTFKMLEDEYGIIVEVIGGAVKGDEDGTGVKKWEEWIGGCL